MTTRDIAIARPALTARGATGGILVTRRLHAVKWKGVTHGIVTLCIGGGQGIALALETL